MNAASRAEDMLQRVRAIWVQAGLPAGDGCERDADDAALSRALVGRIYALLFIASGCVTVLSPFLPSIPTMDRIGVIAIGLVAIGSGCAVLLVPWQRLPRSATLWMVPPAFVLIACHNYFGGSDPYRFSIFFMVAFIAVGIAHPQGTSVRLSPLFALAYVAPLLLRQPISWVGVSSVGYTGAVCLLAGETLAWFSGRLRLAQRALGASEARYRSLAQNASDIVLVVDAGACLRYASPSAAATGVRPEDLCGQSLLAWVHPDDRSQVTGLLEASLAAPGASATAEWRYRHASGRWRYVEAIASNLMAEPSVEGVVITARDIEERKTLAAQLAHQAFHDPLTGLANRALLLERLEHNLRRLRSHPGVLAILVLDLDDFKLVNDSLGHEHGDELLLAVAQRLRDAVDPADSIARWSGDEFVILAEGRPSLDEAIDLADAVLNALERPVVVRGRELFASVSIGVAVHHAHDDKTADVLLREADVAVHRAKARGKHRSVVYDLSMDARAAERLELTLDLRRALDRSEFVPYYQPMVALATGEVALREALIRWRHPRRGVIPPGAFIPLAEDSHMIVPVGRWMLSQACRDAQAWSAGCLDAPMVSVNLSARQVAQPDLATVVAEVLGETGLDPSRLVLEITETTLMEDIAATREMLIRLKDLGLCLAIDDFGTGYSSLAYLKELPVDFVKIDRSFIAGLARESHDAAIVAAIITVAHSLGLRVVAEGIEEPEQLALLRSLDCDLAQGFLLARPAPLKASELVA